MMKTLSLNILLLSLLFQVNTFAQERGINNDPTQSKIGEKPYEMKGRKEHQTPIAAFEDCTKWIVETESCDAKLYRTEEEKIYRKYSGKLVFTPKAKRSRITLKLEKPITLKEGWDVIDFWNWGAHWLWGNPDWNTSFRHYALIEDADGKIHELRFSQSGYPGMVHRYWFLSHIKNSEDIKQPAKFVGIKFIGNRSVKNGKQTYYLGPIYVYKEKLSELTFEKWPEKLPFPVRTETILPTNKNTEFKNKISKKGENYIFEYKAKDTNLKYLLKYNEGLLNGIYVSDKGEEIQINKGAEIEFKDDEKAEWKFDSAKISKDTLFVNATATLESKKVVFKLWYTINQKSLVIGINEQAKEGSVSKITLGKTVVANDAKLINVPFLVYGTDRHPNILYSDGLFYFKQFDWYYSDASDFIRKQNKIKKGLALYNAGIAYIPKTNGVLNPVHEKLFITVSPDVQELLPTIDNPKSTMGSMMSDRLWMTEGSPDYEKLHNQVKELRALGLEKVAIRYHEGFWRDGGESYTFRTETAPKRGGNEAVKELVKYVKNKGWLVGLYSNYTDFAPVNANWNPDWVKQGPKGEWEVSWSRCYSPKPMVALEQERKNAPIIHEQFGTNFSYCDVHTAVSPISRVDYDYRVPGAATFRRSFECYGLILMNETSSYHGPVYSEGKYHWFYAGLVDGNYANSVPELNKTAVFPDFQLLKIHPLEMDGGNTGKAGAEYLAYTLAYGHIGIVSGDNAEKVRRYAILQPLQKYYSMVEVKSIKYFDEGKYYNSSDAVIKDLIKAPKLALEYKSGLKVYVNFSDDNWKITSLGQEYSLPKHGFLAVHEKDNVIAFDGFLNDSKNRIQTINAPGNIYLDTYGKYVDLGDFACDGKVYVKNEKFGWEIIPATDFNTFSFKLSALGITSKNIEIEGLDVDDMPMGNVEFSIENGKVTFKHSNKEVLKYRISEMK